MPVTIAPMRKYRIFTRLLLHPVVILLFTTFFFISRYVINDNSIFSIKTEAQVTSIVHFEKSIQINVISTYINLGQIIIKFKQTTDSQGQVHFTIMEKGITTSKFTSNYDKRVFSLLPKFPFGIPIIPDSKGKEYIIEVGTLGNNGLFNLELSNEKPIVELLHQYKKDDLFKINGLGQFILAKLSQYGKQAFYSGNIYFYFFPLLIYYLLFILDIFFYDIVQKNLLFQHILSLKKPSFLLVLASLFGSSFLGNTPGDWFIVIISTLWLLLLSAYKYGPEKSYILTFILLFLCPALMIVNLQQIAENIAIWAYMFIILGTVHAFIDLKSRGHVYFRQFFNLITYIDSKLIELYKRSFVKKHDQMTLKNELIQYILFTLFLVGFFAIVFTTFTAYIKLMSYRDRKLKNPVIKLVEPTSVYPGTKVVLFGESFGGKSDERNRLIQNGKEIRTDYWEDHKIIFTVPLDWKTGNIDIWIEKPVEWNGETIIEKTKPITIKLLKVTDKFTPDDELYFEQMKTWRQETKVLNGYE